MRKARAQSGHRPKQNQASSASTRAQWTPDPSSPRLLTLKAAAGYLGLTVWALRERIWAGHVPVVRFPGGRKMWIDRADLDRLIDRHKEVIQ